MKSWLSIFKNAVGYLRDFWDEKAVKSAHGAPLSRVHRFAHFWLMVGKSFSHNRCPMRASGLAYISLLALIPMLFVVFSVSSSILGKGEGSDRISHFVYQMIKNMTPPTTAPGKHLSGATDATNVTGTNIPTAEISTLPQPNTVTNTNDLLNATTTTTGPPVAESTNAAPLESTPEPSRDELEYSIRGFVHNIQSGKLGVLGVVTLVFVAISMLSSIESTFNDIWSVTRGRTWMARIIQYWAVISLGPIVVAVVLGLASNAHVETTGQFLQAQPFTNRLLFHFLPIVLLCFAFSLFYLLIPNTKVHWDAALVGGFVGGILWHLNNYFSVLYVSRWITNSKIYGNLAIIPVFMAGLYFSWLIVLFGAQVAHAFQNRAAYLQEKQAENINQRGREFVALRMMECIGQHFYGGKRAPTVAEIADGLAAPTRLINQIMRTLLAAQLVVETTGIEPSYTPARPLENMTCHDILLAMRAGQGEELATRDEPARAEVYGEFERILAAEKQAAGAVTVLGMVTRTAKLPPPSAKSLKISNGEAK